MRLNAAPKRLVESLRDGLVASREQGAIRLPVALAATADHTGAEGAIEAELDRLADRDDAAANRFRQFAQGFRALNSDG